jgi:hypothetical protein
MVLDGNILFNYCLCSVSVPASSSQDLRKSAAGAVYHILHFLVCHCTIVVMLLYFSYVFTETVCNLDRQC